MAKKTETLLKEHGFTEVSEGKFIPERPSSERWERAGDGWYCYAPPSPTFGGGAPWGRAVSAALMQVPFKQRDSFANVSGLHPSDHPEQFEWVWPDERVNEIYAYAVTDGDKGNQFVKVQNDDGTYHFEEV